MLRKIKLKITDGNRIKFIYSNSDHMMLSLKFKNTKRFAVSRNQILLRKRYSDTMITLSSATFAEDKLGFPFEEV